jgi:hypothetical protein
MWRDPSALVAAGRVTAAVEADPPVGPHPPRDGRRNEILATSVTEVGVGQLERVVGTERKRSAGGRSPIDW